MSDRFLVYMHVVPNGKVYIGISKQEPEKRWGNGQGYKSNAYFYADISKYGWMNISHNIIKTDLSADEACELEIQLIRTYDSTNPEKGYNIRAGGGCGTTIDKLRDAEKLMNQYEEQVRNLKEQLRKIKIVYECFFSEQEDVFNQTEAEVRAYAARLPLQRILKEADL